MVASSVLYSALLFALAAAPSAVEAHGFIKQWGVKGQTLEKAQKTDIKASAFRAVASNTGWIGAQFVDSKAIACGASDTPFGKVAAPGGTLFATQGAGKDLPVTPGQSVQLVVSGNPGEGWPHPKGHIMTYLAQCDDDCSTFDASQGKFFKIQEEKDGVPNTLRPAYDGGVDGNRYNVAIPESIPAGNYIMRFEILAFGQSSQAEGGQDQYYPFCGQLTVGGGTTGKAFDKFATVSFPGAYKKGNIDQSTTPGPAVLATIGGSSGSSSTGTESASAPSTTDTSGTSSISGAITLASSAPACASMCLNVKLSQSSSLASQCAEHDGACFCAATGTFVAAYNNCAADNCSAGDLDAAKTAFSDACSALGSARRRSAARMVRARSALSS
ncbi:lytic polysaccharide monooxygenase [Polyporus arcularius HHB13444]|uniref:lytic cellulose monooxygenase (C4-dehydrogenating) n=1 Tax=Polyporus arcularius HHB13444 TaxID=1314778 RepID=A0A5C3PK61_9APHY|nr:lytic polysaccharide monooxygenase [Polyporus arcularius HHB13444]